MGMKDGNSPCKLTKDLTSVGSFYLHLFTLLPIIFQLKKSFWDVCSKRTFTC